MNAPIITGTTRLFAIIGDPVAQARSPEMFNAMFRARGVDAAMVALHAGAEGLAPLLAALRGVRNLDGLVITVPHKITACESLAARSRRADLSGAANVLRRCAGGWEGDLLDGEGFVAGLAGQGIEPRGLRCAIVGAGGAGTAIAFALAGRAASLSVWDITRERAELLVHRLAAAGVSAAMAVPGRKADLVVNATPLGMAESDALPFDPAPLGRHAIVADVVMKPPVTRLLRLAASLGHRTVEGRHMLEGQAELIWRFFGLPGGFAHIADFG